MPLVSDASIEDHTGTPSKLAKDVLVAASHAERHIRMLIGDATYDAVADSGAGTDGYDQLQEAESLLCLRFAIPRTNLHLTKGGGVVRQAGQRDAQKSYLSARETDEMLQRLEEQAIDILDYMGVYHPTPEGEDEALELKTNTYLL